MSKAIMISIRPKWVAKILNGEKTWEIRKSLPKCKLPIDVYIYCCKPRRGEIGCHINFKRVEGKVVAKCRLTNVRKAEYVLDHEIMCLAKVSMEEYYKYVGGKENRNKGCIWGIKDLEIFDDPKELSEFKVRSHKVNGIGLNGEPQKFEILKPLNNPPQSWQFIEGE